MDPFSRFTLYKAGKLLIRTQVEFKKVYCPYFYRQTKMTIIKAFQPFKKGSELVFLADPCMILSLISKLCGTILFLTEKTKRGDCVYVGRGYFRKLGT